MKLRADCAVSGRNNRRESHEMYFISKLGAVYSYRIIERVCYVGILPRRPLNALFLLCICLFRLIPVCSSRSLSPDLPHHISQYCRIVFLPVFNPFLAFYRSSLFPLLCLFIPYFFESVPILPLISVNNHYVMCFSCPFFHVNFSNPSHWLIFVAC